uniref:Uncharacterized protein n=1 Tax=Saiwaicho virus TaxID=2170594 RepID=A0A2S0S4N5_9VIRU|nr:hypothetical protein [Saiwaicho virus]
MTRPLKKVSRPLLYKPVLSDRNAFQAEVRRLMSIKTDVPKQKQKKPRDFDLQSAFDDILTSFKGSFSKPLVVLSLVLVSALVITHQDTFSTGVVGKWVNENKDNSTLAQWIDTNQKKFLGAAIFSPVLFDIPKTYQMPVIIGTALWIMLVPEYSIFQYVVQAFALHTFFKVKYGSTRSLLVMCVAVFYFFQSKNS